MQTKSASFDVAESLQTPDDMATYLEACIEEADEGASFISKILGNNAHARRLTQSARE